jgi:hypothetical protein
MNSPLAIWAARFALDRILARACPSAVPRSGEDGKRVDCFIVKLRIGEEPPIVILDLQDDKLSGLAWGGERYSEERRIALRNVHFGGFDVTHFYGLAEIRYSGLLDFLIGRLTAWPYVKVHLWHALNRIDQFFFNKKKLITKQRMELLQFLIRRHLDGKSEFSPMSLMTDLYSMRWVEHPNADLVEQRLEFYLDSMVETGELRRVSHEYQVTGKALKGIEDYEEQERKHTENVKMQRRMLWLTLIIAALAAVQAGLIRLPPLLDFAD